MQGIFRQEVFRLFSSGAICSLIAACWHSTGLIVFARYRDEGAAQRALDNPRIEVNGKVCNVLAKKQVMA